MGSRTGFRNGREQAYELPGDKSLVRECAESILVCALIVIFLRGFVVQQSHIPSGSMEDTLLVGDTILVNRFVFAPVSFAWEREILPTRPIRRGDVVVVKHPPAPEQDYIKRVAGLPGEMLELRDGLLFIDDRRVDEPHLNELYRVPGRFGPVQVPEEHYFLLGDHRNRSADSRVWGAVPRRLVKGHAFLVLFSTETTSDPAAPAGQVTVRSVARKLVDLVFRARWDRALRGIS